MKAEEHYLRGVDLFAEDKLNEALAAYQQALEQDPGYTDAMHGMAQAYLRLERFDDAITISRRIAEVEPDDALAHTNMSIAYQRKGMIPEAESEGALARALSWKQQLKE